MKPPDLLLKSRRSALSARLLLDAGDTSGASNRAYYAMFDAARAALFVAVPLHQSETIKTHSGLIGSFSLHVINSGFMRAEFGKWLRQSDSIRTIADYSDEEIDPDTCARAVEQAEQFVDAAADYITRPP